MNRMNKARSDPILFLPLILSIEFLLRALRRGEFLLPTLLLNRP